jgi:large subunit ribosomal protein L24e
MYAGKEMLVDSTVQFAARRNVPTRYDRELWANTLQAMERVSEIRARRERIFYKKRMAGNRARKEAENRKLVAHNEHLLRGIEKRRVAELATEHGVDKESVVTRASQKSKVFGFEIRQLRSRIDGSVEEVTGRTDKMDMD